MGFTEYNTPGPGISRANLHAAVCLLAMVLSTCVVMGADKELVMHQNEQDIIENTLGMHVSHSGYYPSKFLKISVNSNPLLDQPNLSSHRVRKRKEGAIHGSRKAYIVTKTDYLKKEWCKTELVKQTIRKKGCLNKTILNRFCYGQCNSFFIPRRRGDSVEKNAFESCAFCRPKTTEFVRATLNCPDKAVKKYRKKVQVIKTCSCMALNLE